ncbi:glutamine amidotransferase [Escherichia coli]|uniref:glutamine amidotransferase n=1 Tax=Escherichia coli TaxID=562 RepID=UPI003986FEE4
MLRSDFLYQPRIKLCALELIKEYVNNGGGLLMTVVYLSFMGIETEHNYKNIALQKILPTCMTDSCKNRANITKGVIAQPSLPNHATQR